MGILYCDGERFRRAFLAGASWLAENKEILNQLNVFPVPDGDTGTNMSLTLISAIDEMKGMNKASLEEMLEAAARGTLMGARGCSGVIFSQLLAGFAEAGRNKEKLYSQDIAAGLRLGSERAYHAVSEPVEGTILTVVRESSEEAIKAAKNNEDIVKLLEAVLRRARISLENSPNLLPRLAQAGVVDSGGQGFVYMLEGILRLLGGETIGSLQKSSAMLIGTAQARVTESWENPYCTEFLLTGDNIDTVAMKSALAHLGVELVVIKWNELVRVHIHTSDPEQILTVAHSYGEPTRVKIDDTKSQHRHIIQIPQDGGAGQEISIVTTAPGGGLKAICTSMGAEFVIVGDETRNPSVSELVSAIDDAYSQQVIVLPNDGNIIPAAIQAASMSSKQVKVIPSRNTSQGLAALVSFQPDADMDENAENMEAALGEVKHGEVARAVRNARYGELEIKENDIIGMFEGKICLVEDDHTKAVLELLTMMVDEDSGIIAVFYGAEIGKEEAEQVLEEVESAFPEIEAELHYGGQSYCSYILSVE